MTDINQYLGYVCGYVVLSRAEYDELLEQRFSNRCDRIDEQKDYYEEIGHLNGFLEEKQNEILILHDQIEENKRTIETLRHQVFSLSTVKEDLQKKIMRYNDFLWERDLENDFREYVEHNDKIKAEREEPINAALDEVRGI